MRKKQLIGKMAKALAVSLILFVAAGILDDARASNGMAPDDSHKKTISIGSLQDIPIDIEELDLMEEGLYDEDIKPLAELKSLRKLDLSWNDITDLTPLSNLENLEELCLQMNSIMDLTPLAGLSRLENLDISVNYGITDLTPLYQLPALRELNAGGLIEALSDISILSPLTELTVLSLPECGITDLEPLAGLTALEDLHLGYNVDLADITPLRAMKWLRVLYLSRTAVTDISALGGMKSLESLWLWDTGISDLSPLVEVTSLKVLDLSTNPIEDLSPLAGMTKLKVLDLRACQFSDLSPLFSLASLEVLAISENERLTRESVEMLKEKLPNTEIISDFK